MPGTCSSAPTAATTPAARPTGVRWCERCERRDGPTRSGSARTSGATGSPATSCCCPTASTSAAQDPAGAERLLEAHDRGRLDLTGFRGRSTFRLAEQAAEHVRADRRGLDAIDAVRAMTCVDDGRVVVWSTEGGELLSDGRADGARRIADAADVQGEGGAELPGVPPRRARTREVRAADGPHRALTGERRETSTLHRSVGGRPYCGAGVASVMESAGYRRLLYSAVW